MAAKQKQLLHSSSLLVGSESSSALLSRMAKKGPRERCPKCIAAEPHQRSRTSHTFLLCSGRAGRGKATLGSAGRLLLRLDRPLANLGCLGRFFWGARKGVVLYAARCFLGTSCAATLCSLFILAPGMAALLKSSWKGPSMPGTVL